MQTTDSRRPGGVLPVAVKKVDGTYRLYRAGKPFFVKGAGGGHRSVASLAVHGANSLRTWSTRDGGRILDDAHAAGLTVLMGLTVTPERHGFDYDDPDAVKAQLERVTAEIKEFKDHPALLAWGIGNELNLGCKNLAVWTAVNDIARMIHEVDGNHPATTMLAGVNKPVVDAVRDRVPELDFLCVQMYGSVIHAREHLSQAGYAGPYLITEWGATGHWEVKLTDWGAPVEQTSSEKADAILERYNSAILGDSENCMGSYVFLWGQKQERTPTWYGLFTEDGRETEAVDVMQCVWTGAWPDHRAPRVTDITINGKGRYESVRLSPGKVMVAQVTTDAGPGVTATAEILPEATVLGEGGDFEPRPEAVPGAIRTAGVTAIEFTAPMTPGPYRLLVSLLDQYNHAATANLPFLVE